MSKKPLPVEEAKAPPSCPPECLIPPNLRGYIRFFQARLKQCQKHQAVQERQIRHLREDCLRMHSMLRALIRRSYSVEREAISAERLLSRLHFRVEQRFGPGGDMLVPRRIPRPRRGRREKPRPW